MDHSEQLEQKEFAKSFGNGALWATLLLIAGCTVSHLFAAPYGFYYMFGFVVVNLCLAVVVIPKVHALRKERELLPLPGYGRAGVRRFGYAVNFVFWSYLLLRAFTGVWRFVADLPESLTLWRVFGVVFACVLFLFACMLLFSIWISFFRRVRSVEERPEEASTSPATESVSKPGLRLIKTATRSVSKLGGQPNLPDSLAWPRNPEGVELDLLAQIHCPELPAGLGLPASGTLFVFYDCEKMPWGDGGNERDYWKILYTAEALPEQPRQRQTQRKDYDDSAERFLAFEQFDSRKEIAEDDESETDTVAHQLLGYPGYIQDEDMGEPGKILLLQLDSDDDLDWLWGDVGRLFFWIAPEDLAKCDFNRVQQVMECS